jgi:hypothetical protein
VRRRRATGRARPTPAQKAWLTRGLGQPGGKLPLFDEQGQHYPQRTIRSCISQGWAEPWFDNPLKPDWMVCRLTEAGRGAARLNRRGLKRLAIGGGVGVFNSNGRNVLRRGPGEISAAAH